MRPRGGNDARAGAAWRSEVRTIRARATGRAEIMRAGIRLAAGRAAQVVISVKNHPDAGGVALAAPGRFTTQDTTVFSQDVAVHGARTVGFFSNARGGERAVIVARSRRYQRGSGRFRRITRRRVARC